MKSSSIITVFCIFPKQPIFLCSDASLQEACGAGWSAWQLKRSGSSLNAGLDIGDGNSHIFEGFHVSSADKSVPEDSKTMEDLESEKVERKKKKETEKKNATAGGRGAREDDTAWIEFECPGCRASALLALQYDGPFYLGIGELRSSTVFLSVRIFVLQLSYYFDYLYFCGGIIKSMRQFHS